MPAPTISGDTATYPAVLPGVDLRIVAQADTYTQVLVVNDATAAANPALANIRLTATGTGVNLAVRPDGGLSATDPVGAEVFHGPAPVMWDSRHDDQLGPRPTATNQGSGHVTRLTVTGTPRTAARSATATSTTDLILNPDPATLAGQDVVYPLYIDPSMSVRKQHWLRITDNGWSNHWDDDAAEAQVGYCGGWNGCDGHWRARSFFQLDSTPLRPRNGVHATIFRAQFYIHQIWSADHYCEGGQPTVIWQTDTIRADTPWGGPLSLALDTQYSNAGGPCPTRDVVFNVATAARNAAGGGWPYLTFGLVAQNENEPLQWKRFVNNPLLEVDFSFPPNNATGLKVSNEVRCTGKAITPDANPTLYATASDNNSPPLQPALWHHVRTADDSRTISSSSGIRIGSGSQGQWRIPNQDRLSDGDWKFRVYVNNNPGHPHNLHNPANEGFSAWYPFTVRATPPSAAPRIESTIDYPANYWGAPNGAPGAIAINANGAANIVGYTYTFTGSGTEVVPGNTDCNYTRSFGTTGGWIAKSGSGPDWIPIPAGLPPGFRTIHVRSFDDAHNLSPESSHTFYVPPNTGLGRQRIEAETLPRSQPPNQNVPLGPENNCCEITWSGGAQLVLRGNATGQSFTLSFTVPAESVYQIGVGLTRSVTYGQFTVRLDGQPIGHPTPGQPPGSFEAYNRSSITTHQPLGIRHLTPGTHTLTFTTTGTSPQSVGDRYRIGVDYLDLIQSTRVETEDGAQVTWRQPDGQNISLGPQTNCCWSLPWSNGAQLGFFADRPGTSFDIIFRVPIEADYALGAGLTKADDYGKLTFLLDDKPLANTDTAPWDGYSSTITTVYQPLGGAHLTAGQHKLTVTVVGTNPASVNLRHVAGIDYLSAVPVNNVTAASFAAAMNNDGITSDGTPAAPQGSGVMSDPILSRAGWTVTASSQQTGGINHPVGNVLDGNAATIWHSQYTPTLVPHPHSLTIDMHTTATVTGLRYLPRTDGSPNGRIGQYQIDISTDGTTWSSVATGAFPDTPGEKAVPFTPASTRYVRLTALSEAGNRGQWTTAAEINLTGIPTPTISRAGWTVTADSQQTGTFNTPASNAIDGNPGTIWHTAYSPTVAALPHTFTIDMHATRAVSGVRYLPRTDGSPNGRIGQYQVHLSTDGTTWGNPVATGTFPDTAEEKAVAFTPTSTRYVRLTARTEAGNRGQWTTAAEINLTGIPAITQPGAGLDLAGATLSAQTLAAAGYATGTGATIDGATFTMPAPNNAYDNVIAIGQTIPFPANQQVKASAVGLLAASTCGTSRANHGTVTYTDNTTENVPFPAVEDWVGMPPDHASVTLPYRNEGAATNAATAPRLVALFAPANPTKVLKSITLPNYGTSLLPGSCSSALHVFAMAPRPAVSGWIGAWAAPADAAVPPAGDAGFANQTLRTVIHPTVTGNSIRVRLGNPHAAGPVTFGAVSLASQSGNDAATVATPVRLAFGGNAQVTIPAGGEALSDPVTFPAMGGGSGSLTVSMHVTGAVTGAAVHGYPAAPTFLAPGDATADPTGTPFTVRLAGSRYVSGVEVSTTDSSHGTVAVLGDQLTAIAPRGDGYRPTWVDTLPATLAAAGVTLPGGLVNTSQAGVSPAGHWRLDDATGTVARDSAGSADATLTGGATWNGDRGGSVTLDGSTGCLTTAERVLVTTASYTVSAWVKLNTTGAAAQTVVSQDGINNNAFALQYTGTAANKWAFTLPATSANGATSIRVLSRDPVQPGVWTHLVGSYDAARKVADLYVNGAWQGWASHTTPWPTAGPLAIGRGKANGSPTAFLNGSVSGIRAYQRAANGIDASILHAGSPVPGDQPGLGALSATDASNTLNRTVLNQPALRTVIVALGANDLLAGKSIDEMRRELTKVMHFDPNSPGGIGNSRRSDGSPVHVIATTVPPLGLVANDAREQARQQFNADLLARPGDYGADEVVDLAAAVQDPAQPNQINPAYLSGGAPNAAYHNAIAQAIADAASRFPPEARL